MTVDQARLEAASREALARRARLKAGTEALKARLMPSRLVSDGKAHVSAQAKSAVAESKAHVRAHPVVTAAVVGGLMAWIFRKPLLRFAPPLLGRSYDWLAGKLPFSQIDASSKRSELNDEEEYEDGDYVADPDLDEEPDDEPGETTGGGPDDDLQIDRSE